MDFVQVIDLDATIRVLWSSSKQGRALDAGIDP